MHMRRLTLGMALVAVMLLAANCAPSRPAEPDPLNLNSVEAARTPETPAGPPLDLGVVAGRIEGNVSNVERVGMSGEQGHTLGTIRIEGEKNPNNEYDKAVVTVTRDTLIYRQDGDALVPVTFEALEFGQTVIARFTGPIKESYPIQVDGSEIVILRQAPRN